MNLYLSRSGRLRRKDNTLFFESVELPEDADYAEDESEKLEKDESDRKISLPVESIDSIYIFREVTLNSKLVHFLGQKKIPVHFFNYYGHHDNTLLPHAEQLSGDLVIRQVEFFRDPARRMEICRSILDAAFHNMLSNLRYYGRRSADTAEESEKIEKLRSNLGSAETPGEAMAIEGNIRKIYYSAWKKWLGETAKDFRRSYHPPENPLNALLSFLNSLLYTVSVSELYRTALYPGISYLHEPQTRRYSLALDMTEPFKPVLADRLLFQLWNKQLISAKDFREYSNGWLLTDSARRKILEHWDDQMKTTHFIDRLKRSVSYRQLIRLDCYKLIRFLLESAPFTSYRKDD